MDMAKRVASVVLDGAFNVLNDAVREAVCSAEPTNFANIAAVRLAEATMAAGDFTIAAGDAGGDSRKCTMAAKSGTSITATGTATHVVLHDNSAIMHYVTTCSSQALTSGGTVNIPAWKVEIASPT
jgi:hypothetical protein